ncbi:MAG TPA: glycosyltransferase family 2 protein [Anaerolineales bacterium]|nr:glycosyltransferase family 2 protein [Anaerolineales bacterium]
MTDFSPQPHKPLVAAIVPMYNEELNVKGVLAVLHATSLLDEIIMVDDGSSDGTVEILRQAAQEDPRIRVIQHEKNKGKGQAVFTGWSATSAPIILLLDADLKDLTPDHIKGLLNPVLEHRADMTLGLFRGGHFNTDLSHRLTPFLTGQRGLRADLLKYISREAAAGYGFEVALTVAASQRGYRTRVVPLHGVWHPSSEIRTERGGYWHGKLWRFRMYGQILRAWYIATRERYPNARAFFSERSKL